MRQAGVSVRPIMASRRPARMRRSASGAVDCSSQWRARTMSSPPYSSKRVGAVAVAAGAADLLVVGFGAVRHIQVDDEAHVRTVDTHAECDGGDHDHRLAGAETASAPRASPSATARRGTAWRAGRPRFRLCATRSVFELGCRSRRCRPGRRAGFFRKAFELLPSRPSFGTAAICRLARWKDAANTAASSISSALQDVGSGACVRGGGQGNAGDAGEVPPQPAEQHPVFRAELMAPGGHAMRLVDGDKGDLLPPQPLQRPRTSSGVPGET